MRRAAEHSRTLISVAIAVALAGCAITKMTSQVNPETRGRTIDRVLVHGNFQSLEYRQLAEEKLCTELVRSTRCECLKSSEVFFPGEDHSPDQISTRLTELSIDGVLILQPTGSGTSSTYIPPTSRTTGSATVTGNTIRGSSTTRTYGGHNVSKPWAHYEATLWSTVDGKVAWYGTASSSGNAFAGWDDLIRSASGKTVKKLVADGVLEKP